jgi:MoaA/NifB/PqqE/SkfB family radical SAM enzyme
MQGTAVPSISFRQSAGGHRCRFRPSTCRGVRVVARLTARCPLHCGHCLAGVPGRPAADLPLSEWKAILGEMRAIGAHKVLLTGGEPLVFQGLAELTHYVAEMGVSTDLNSTLWSLTPALADELAANGLTEASISLEGPEPIHDAMHGTPGAWARLKTGVALLQQRGLPVDGSLCVTRTNLRYVEDTIQEAARWRLASFTVSRLFPVGHGIRAGTVAVSDGQLEGLHERLTARGASKYGLPVRLVGLLGAPEASDCGQGESILGLRADGALTPCVLSRDRLAGLPKPAEVGLAEAVARMRALLDHIAPTYCWGDRPVIATDGAP